jgi:hypothetical protein
MIADGLWLDRKQRIKRVHQPRALCECVGELVQSTTASTWWFEDRGPQCTLLVFVDGSVIELGRARGYVCPHGLRVLKHAAGFDIYDDSVRNGVFGGSALLIFELGRAFQRSIKI